MFRLILCCAPLSSSFVWRLCSIARVVPSLRVLPIDVRRQVVKILCPHVSEEDGDTLFQCVASLPDFPNTTATESDAFHVFSPPCVRCQSHLVRYNNPVEVDYYHLTGSSKGIKCSLKCSWCDIFYGYTKYGNPVSGWNLYSAPRPAVEASDVCFVQREIRAADPSEISDLFGVSCFLFFCVCVSPSSDADPLIVYKKSYSLLISLYFCLYNYRCHSWVSFSGFSTAFNELHDLQTGKK